MGQYLALAWAVSIPAILAICLLLRMKARRLFEAEPRRLLVLLVASIILSAVGSLATVLRLPLPNRTAVFHVGGGLLLAYLWLRTLELARVARRGRRVPAGPGSGM